jgi:hypothetical protein
MFENVLIGLLIYALDWLKSQDIDALIDPLIQQLEDNLSATVNTAPDAQPPKPQQAQASGINPHVNSEPKEG